MPIPEAIAESSPSSNPSREGFLALTLWVVSARLPDNSHQHSSITPPVHELTNSPPDFVVRIDDEERPVAHAAPVVGHSAVRELVLQPADLGEMATSPSTVVVVDHGGPSFRQCYRLGDWNLLRALLARRSKAVVGHEAVVRVGKDENAGLLDVRDGPPVGDQLSQRIEQVGVKVSPLVRITKIGSVPPVTDRSSVGMQVPSDTETFCSTDRPQKSILDEVPDIPDVTVLHTVALLSDWPSGWESPIPSGAILSELTPWFICGFICGALVSAASSAPQYSARHWSADSAVKN